jgi:hypothetical protein
MVRSEGRRPSAGWVLPALAIGAILFLSPNEAAAQGIGFHGGVTVDPDQAHFGTFLETNALVDRLHFRPGITAGFGEHVLLATVDFIFVYRFPLGTSGWSLYQGSGPVLVIYKFDEKYFGVTQTDLRGGLDVLFGVSHDSGFFTEIRVGAADSPNLRAGAGFKIGF